MSAERFGSFEEFWPYYVRAHSNPGNRALHFAGTTAAVACAAAALLLRRPKLALLGPVIGYAAAWIGHFGIEKNVPATFGHPLWSFKADFVMWSKIVNGTMDAEVERAMAQVQDAADSPSAASGGVEPKRAQTAEAPRPDRYAVN